MISPTHYVMSVCRGVYSGDIHTSISGNALNGENKNAFVQMRFSSIWRRHRIIMTGTSQLLQDHMYSWYKANGFFVRSWLTTSHL